MNIHEIRNQTIACRDVYQKDIDNPELKNTEVWKQATLHVRKLNQVIKILDNL